MRLVRLSTRYELGDPVVGERDFDHFNTYLFSDESGAEQPINSTMAEWATMMQIPDI